MRLYRKIISFPIMISILFMILTAGVYAEDISPGRMTVVKKPFLTAGIEEQIFYPRNISGITFSGAKGNTGYAKKNLTTGEATLFASYAVDEMTYTDKDGNYVFVVKKGCVEIPVNVICAGNYDITVNYLITPNAKLDTSKTFYWILKVNGEKIATTDAHGGKTGRSNTEKISWNAGTYEFNGGENVISFELFEPDGYARSIIIESIVITPNRDYSIYSKPTFLNVTANPDNIETNVFCNNVLNEPWVVTAFSPVKEPEAGKTYIEFKLDAPTCAEYEISFTKIGLMSGVRCGGKWDVAVNGVNIRTVDFSHNYRNKKIEKITAYLSEGENSVRLTYNSTISQAEETGNKYGVFLTDINAVPLDKNVFNSQEMTITNMPSDGRFIAKATVFNNTAYTGEATLIAVVYDKIGEVSFITDINSETKTLQVGETLELCVPLTVDYGLSSANIKLFIRDNYSIQPIIEPTIIVQK